MIAPNGVRFEEASPEEAHAPIAVFKGHSGARVTLHRQEGRSVVRKMAHDVSRNERLQRQAAKQALFRAMGVPTPSILRRGFDGGLFFFEMDYIPAISIAAECAAGSTASQQRLAIFLRGWIDQRRTEIVGTITPDHFVAKVRSVVAACRDNPVLANSMPVIDLLAVTLSHQMWPIVPESSCHGDLTLENILVDNDGRLSLIDFDAPDLASYWLDLAKLYQDLSGFWCLRRLAADDRSVSYTNAVIALRQLRTTIDGVLEQAIPGLLSLLPALVALNLLRTLPYCDDLATALFVINRVNIVIAEQPFRRRRT